MKRTPKKKIPHFKTEAQEADFWSKHSPLDYSDEFKPTNLRLFIHSKKRIISVPLNEKLWKGVRRLASRKHVPCQTFIRSIIAEKVRATAKKAA